MNARENRGRLHRTGFTLIELVVVIVILGILVAIILPAIQQAREASRRTQCRANLHQIGVALHNYLDARGTFPPGFIKGYSTHVFLLPYIEQNNLYENFDFSAQGMMNVIPNDKLTQSRITLYECPSDSRNIGIHTSPGDPSAVVNYGGNGGTWSEDDGIFQTVGISPYKGICVRTSNVRDGISNTTMMSEVLVGRDITDPRLVIFRTSKRYGPGEFDEFLTDCQNAPFPPLNGSRSFGYPWINGSLGITRYSHVLTPNTRSCLNGGNWVTAAFTASSDHPGGVNLLVADGSVQFISDSIDDSVWRALGSINGGEPSKPAW